MWLNWPARRVTLGSRARQQDLASGHPQLVSWQEVEALTDDADERVRELRANVSLNLGGE